MKENNSDALERIDWWVSKFKSEIVSFKEAYCLANPDADSSKAAEEFYLNKIATLCVGMEELKNNLAELKSKN